MLLRHELHSLAHDNGFEASASQHLGKARGRTGEVTAKNVMFTMYCLELAEWPCLNEASLLEVVNIMNMQAEPLLTHMWHASTDGFKV